MLTKEQLRLREYKTTASTVPIIMSGDAEKLITLWRERTGEIAPHDFSNDWPVKLGEYLESFVLDWHQKQTGYPLIDRGQVVQHPEFDYIAATIDAYREYDDCVIDCKVSNAWYPLEDIIAYYTPQIIVQMRCRNAAHGSLLIVHGTAEPREYDIIPDPDYEREMWGRVAAFQLCVETLTPPASLPKIVPPEQYRTVDLGKLSPSAWPNWSHSMVPHLKVWRDTKEAADLHTEAVSDIKKILPDDVGRFLSDDGSVVIKRDRRGYLSIKRSAA